MSLVKTLNFDEEVLEVLRRTTWSEDGLSAVMPEMERKVYEKVNKALSVMGGKWNRSAQAHLFQFDPRSQVVGLIESGSLKVERDGFFETPRAVVERMLELAPLPRIASHILEPSAGLGAILKGIEADPNSKNAVLFAIEKNENRREYIRDKFPNVQILADDFMKFRLKVEVSEYGFQRIYMNPPFEEGQDIDHVRYAHGMLAENGLLVAVMGEGAFFRKDNKASSFRDWLEDLEGHSEKLPEGSFKESGTGVNTRLVLVRK
jgi:16S rRNA G966 N2-methylase RsmD